jgi:hypothetical protein
MIDMGAAHIAVFIGMRRARCFRSCSPMAPFEGALTIMANLPPLL